MNETDDRHPDVTDLDLARTGEAEPWVRAHLESCAACRETLHALETLAGGLRAEAPANAAPLASADRAVADMIRRRAEEIGRGRRSRNRVLLPSWAGRAAAAALVAGLAGLWLSHALRTRSAAMARADVTGDGAVDILDAYAVASRVASGAPAPGGWDLNRDGRVDDTDVRLVAARAVRLERSGT